MAEASLDDQPAVLFERRSEIAVVRLNRPKARNAVNGAVTAALSRIVGEVENDPTLRVAVLGSTSAAAFCAGADLAAIASGQGKDLTTAEGGFGGFVYAQRRKPWIAAVAGFAMGGGLELALAADMIVAGESAVFGLPEALRGLVAGAGGMFRLPRVVPRAIAIEMLTTGLRLSAPRALAFGLVNVVVPDHEVIEEAVRLAIRVAAAAPLAVLESITVARAADDRDEAELWQLSAAAAARVMASNDAMEGARAFVDKRTPAWTGS